MLRLPLDSSNFFPELLIFKCPDDFRYTNDIYSSNYNDICQQFIFWLTTMCGMRMIWGKGQISYSNPTKMTCPKSVGSVPEVEIWED